MKLIVIESPGKRETIQKYLGKDYLVMSSKGHVRDLPQKTFGVDLTKNFEPKYEILPDKKSVIEDIKEKAKKADQVLLATDPDREGEAIAWHLAYCLGIDPSSKCRIVFNEISKNAVEKALLLPRPIDLNLVDAQQARRILDRIMGYKLSPILCKKIKPRLSAGRVQSVALRLVVDREKEIEKFVPEEYWNVNVLLKKNNQSLTFKSTLVEYKNKKVKLTKKEEVDSVLENLKTASYIVSSLKKTKTKSKAPAPFTTSTMQQDALNKLNMSLKRTTQAAQQLYEGIELPNEGKIAFITYIRTDSVRISDDAVKMAREHILTKYGEKYLPKQPNVFHVKENAQDAHEAIRPISLARTPESIKDIAPSDAYKLYKLIYERFVACQMVEAEYDNVTAQIKANECTFKSVGKTLTFAGWTGAYKVVESVEKDEKEENTKLPVLEEGEVLNLVEIKPEQKFTKPPSRYTEATLVKAMEEKGIGRPATYAPTVTVLASRQYTEKDGKYIKPTELGRSVTGFLENYFNKMINVAFTAYMETKLDEIAENNLQWQKVIDDFWKSFKDLLINANFKAYVSPKPEPIETDILCDKCGHKMVIREGKYGKFLGCSNFPNCKNIMPYNEPTAPKGICPECGKEVLQKKSKKGKIFYSCSGYPDCKFMSWDIPTGEKCPECGAYLVKKGKKIICSNSSCKYVKE